MARITLKKPYANVLSSLATNSSLPSFESHLKGIITLGSILFDVHIMIFDLAQSFLKTHDIPYLHMVVVNKIKNTIIDMS
jgi:hypothetical protein